MIIIMYLCNPAQLFFVPISTKIVKIDKEDGIKYRKTTTNVWQHLSVQFFEKEQKKHKYDTVSWLENGNDDDKQRKKKRKEKKKRKIWLRLINPNHFAMLFNEVEGMGIFFNIQVIYQQDYHVKKR